MNNSRKYFAYVRVSSKNQNEARQVQAIQDHFKKIGINDYKLVIDKVSGGVKTEDRRLQEVFSDNYNHLIVYDFDRLGRNLIDSLLTVEKLLDNNIQIEVLKYNITSNLPNGKKNPLFDVLHSILTTFAQQEKERINERQKEGIQIAKAKGVYKGRKEGTSESKEQFLKKYKNVVRALNKNLSLRKTAKLCDVSINTVRKVKTMI